MEPLVSTDSEVFRLVYAAGFDDGVASEKKSAAARRAAVAKRLRKSDNVVKLGEWIKKRQPTGDRAEAAK